MNEITKELLEALKACLKNCARWHPADPAVLGAISAIAKAEAALAEPQAAADGWIPWSGGECPTSHEQVVEVRCKNKVTEIGKGGWFDWDHLANSGYDIVAYRIVKESGK